MLAIVTHGVWPIGTLSVSGERLAAMSNPIVAVPDATAAVALADSPAGLAAWIVEKLRSWCDCNGQLERRFSREEILTWITLYWVTNTIGSSFIPHVEYARPMTMKSQGPLGWRSSPRTW